MIAKGDLVTHPGLEGVWTVQGPPVNGKVILRRDDAPHPQPMPIDNLTKVASSQPVDGGQLLTEVETFLGRFVAYPSEHAHVAHTLWIAHTHLMDHWESTPRIAFLSPEPGSGKSRALEVTEPLVPRPVHAVNVTPSYLFRKVSDDAGPPTILYDEIDTVFGPKAKDNEDVRGMLNAGHRRGAMAGRCVVKGKRVETEELPAYCAVALAGLNDLPDTIMTRSIVVRMRRRASTEYVEPWRLRINGPEGHELRDQLTAWGYQASSRVTWPDIPAGIEDRNADVWEALLAVADLAGGDWPTRARAAAGALVAEAAAAPPSLGVLLLRDLRRVFDKHPDYKKLPTATILSELHHLEESPWDDLRGRPVDARWLSRQLAKYDVRAKVIRTADGTPRGYDRADLADPWSRYLSATSDPLAATSATEPTPDVADVADVADLWGHTGPAVAPGEEPSWELSDNTRARVNGPASPGVWALDGPSPQESATSATSATGSTS